MAPEEQFGYTLEMIEHLILTFIGIKLRVAKLSSVDTRKYSAKHFFIFTAIFIFDAAALIWLVEKARTGMLTLKDANYIPKFIISAMSTVRILFVLANEKEIGVLLKRLQEKQKKNSEYVVTRNELNDRVTKELKTINFMAKVTLYNSIITLGLFMVFPLIFMAYSYLAKGQLELYAPMALSYLFCDSFDYVGWPIAYAHTGIKGTICICGFSCDLLELAQLTLLQAALNTLAFRLREARPRDAVDLAHLINDHQDLLQLSRDMDRVYSKSTLCFYLGSTILICFIAFIISTSPDNLLPFVMLLGIYMGLIFLLSYYGNKITEASLEVGNAVFESSWYTEKVSKDAARCLHIMIIRSQRPCALTVHKFAAVSIHSFTKVLSSAWSYFALLRTFYSEN